MKKDQNVIENIDRMLNAIKAKTGTYPVLFLDNVTALTSLTKISLQTGQV